jgi:hypothetical protein
MNNLEQEQNNININDLQPKELIDITWNALNKSSKAGVFTIDESYMLKVVVDRISKLVLEKKSEN